MHAFAILMMVGAAVAMPYGPVYSGWGAPAPYAVAHAAPVAVAHAPVYSQPIVKQVVSPYVHAPVVKAIAPAASSYSTFTQYHSPVVKVAQPVYSQPIVKVAQPVAYAQPVYSQPIVKVAQPVAYAQQTYVQPSVVKQVVAAPQVYSHW